MKLTIKTFFNKNNFIKNISKKCRVKKMISEKRQKNKKQKRNNKKTKKKRQRDLIITRELYEDPNKKPQNKKKPLMIITTFPQDVRNYSHKEYFNVFIVLIKKSYCTKSTDSPC